MPSSAGPGWGQAAEGAGSAVCLRTAGGSWGLGERLALGLREERLLWGALDGP